MPIFPSAAFDGNLMNKFLLRQYFYGESRNNYFHIPCVHYKILWYIISLLAQVNSIDNKDVICLLPNVKKLIFKCGCWWDGMRNQFAKELNLILKKHFNIIGSQWNQRTHENVFFVKCCDFQKIRKSSFIVTLRKRIFLVYDQPVPAFT